jgi:hypothetical protein
MPPYALDSAKDVIIHGPWGTVRMVTRWDMWVLKCARGDTLPVCTAKEVSSF